MFLTLLAPVRPIRPCSVGGAVARGCERTGQRPVGPHRLRHALAADMLRRGAALPEIGQVLRHRDLASTAVYAKVDLAALRSVARSLAGSGAMSDLSGQAGDYLRLRRALGHKLDDAHRLLPRFVAYLDAIGAETVTVEAALAWARRPDADPASSVWTRRMTVARGFARHMAGIDPGTEVPPPGLVTFRQRRRQPFIYSDADIAALMAHARRSIPSPAAGRDGGDADRAARRDGHAGG